MSMFVFYCRDSRHQVLYDKRISQSVSVAPWWLAPVQVRCTAESPTLCRDNYYAVPVFLIQMNRVKTLRDQTSNTAEILLVSVSVPQVSDYLQYKVLK